MTPEELNLLAFWHGIICLDCGLGTEEATPGDTCEHCESERTIPASDAVRLLELFGE